MNRTKITPVRVALTLAYAFSAAVIYADLFVWRPF